LSSSPYNLGMFPAKRRKVREVDVEVVEPRRDGVIAPVNSDSEALNNGDVPDKSAERPPTTHGDPFRSSLLAVALERIRAENVAEPEPPTTESVADLAEHIEERVDKPRAGRWRRRAREVTEVQATATAPDAEAEMPEPVEQPRAELQERPGPKIMSVPAGEPMLVEAPEPVEADADSPPYTEVPPVEEAIREGPAAEPTAETEVETAEPEEPRSTALPPFKEATEEQPAPAATTRPKSRVVWSSVPAPSAPRAHTLKLTKKVPTETGRQAGANRPTVEQPPVEEPRTAQPPPPEAATTEPAASRIAPDVPAKAPEAVDNFRSAEHASLDEGLQAEPPAPTPPPSEQTCDILFWRGYRKAAFYGRTFDETGEAVAVGESPFFRPQGNGAPDPTEAAKAAYEVLRSQLIAAGWEPVAAGDDWFDETFRLMAAAEPEPE
jgi:hypothetical protein